MNRRHLIALLTGAAVGWPLATRAQRPAMPVIGYLANASSAGFAPFVAAFRRGLSEMGYVEGENVAIEYRWAEGQHDRLPGFVADLVRRSENPGNLLQIERAEVAARTLGIQLDPVPVQGASDFDSAFKVVRASDALLQANAPLFTAHRARIVGLAATSRLPAIYALREMVEVGGLMSYGPDYPDLLRRAATYVDKILRGVNPADLPVEQPTKFEFVINRRTAKALGLTIPPSLLLRADQVIE